MKVRRKFKGRKIKDNKGYLKSNVDNFTPVKQIDGGDITMEGVDIPLLAIPMDANGKPIGMKFMEPGKNYDFEGAKSTMEVPTYRRGGKSVWISSKITKLIDEGYPKEQAIAIAHKMYDKKRYGGRIDYMQGGGQSNSGPVTSEGLMKRRQKFIDENRYYDDIDQAILAAEGVPEISFSDIGEAVNYAENTPVIQNPQISTNGDVNDLNKPFSYNIPTEEDLKEMELQKAEEEANDIAKFASGLSQGDTQFARTEEIDFEKANRRNEILNSNTTPDPGSVQSEQKDFQFFNQYAGVDIPTAAHIFGQNLGKEGSPLKAVASGAKLGLGIARNIASGVGYANSEEFALNEYKEKQRKALVDRDPLQYSQAGGSVSSNLTAQDREIIREDVGFAFDDDYINDVFEKVSPMAPTKPYKPTLGKYEGLDYFTNPVVRDSNISLEVGKRYPEGAEQLKRYVNYLREQNPGYEVEVRYDRNKTFQDGGTTTEELKKRRSAAIIAKRLGSVNDKDKFFSNFEDPELVDYIKKYSELDPKSVEAEANQLYKMIMDKEGVWSAEPIRYAGKQIQSTAKDITNQIFGTSFEEGGDVGEALMTGNYRTGEIGEANVEVEENEYLLTPEGELTKVLGKKHEQGGEKMNLPEGTRIVSDHLKLGQNAKVLKDDFDVKVSPKDTYAKAIDKFYEKSGLKDIIDEEQEVIASIKEQKEKMAEDSRDSSTRNINLEFLSSKIQELNEAKKPLIEAAKVFFDKTYELQEASKTPKKKEEVFKIGGKVYNSDQIIKWGKEFNVDPAKAVEIVRKMKNGGQTDPDPNDIVNEEFFEDMFNSLRSAGYEGSDDIEEMQAWISKNKPKAVLDYFRKGLATYTSKGLQQIAETNPEIFKKAGVPLKDNPGDYTEAERQKIKEVYQKEGLETDEFLLDQFQDGLKAYRSPLLKTEASPSLSISPENPVAQLQLPEVLKYKIANGEPLTKEEEEAVRKAQSEQNGNSGVYIMPDQELLPPSGLIPSTKIERRYGRMEAERFTPDQQLAELNRTVDAAMEQLATLPSGQREAAIVQLQANKQQQADRIISETERLNKDLAQKEEAFNIRQGDREVDASAIDTLSFEQRSLGALANTEDDFRRYYNEGQRRNVERFKEIENLNLLNQMYENFDFTPNGVQNTVGSGLTEEDYMNMLRFQQAVNSGGATSTQSKQKGGAVRKRRHGTTASKGKKTARVYRRKGSRTRKALRFSTPNSTKLT